VIAAATVVPLVFAGVILITFVLLMVDLTLGRKRQEAHAMRSRPKKRAQQKRREHGYEPAPQRAPYRY
jgi:hypothetical protein